MIHSVIVLSQSLLLLAIPPWTVHLLLVAGSYISSSSLRRLRQGCLQYVLINMVIAAVAVILNIFELYDEGHLRFDRGYMYVAIIWNTSITVSDVLLLHDSVGRHVLSGDVLRYVQR